MKLRFIGDLHLDKRPSHSTKASAQRFFELQAETIEKAMQVDDDTRIVQMGDVFDTFEVNSTTFVKALGLAEYFDFIVGGNHDYSNDSTKTSALENLAGQIGQGIVVRGVYACARFDDNTTVYVLPYCATQSLFDEELEKLCTGVKKWEGHTNILCLHVNYDNPRASADIENNLTAAQAKILLDTSFDYILSGHEHNGSDHFGGRLRMVGSVLPHSFAEMEIKRGLEFDTETGKMTSIDLWRPAGRYLQTDIAGFLSLPDDTELQFIEVTGEILPAQLRDLAAKMSKLFNGDHAISIKNSTVTPTVEGTQGTSSAKRGSWLDNVRGQLNDEELELFNTLYGEVSE